jgi:hypothetical protein
MSDPTPPHWTTELTAGRGTAVLGANAILLVDAAPSHPLVQQVSGAILSAGDPSLDLEAALAGAPEELPGFALLVRRADGWHAFLRGSVHAAVRHADGAVATHRAGNRSGWTVVSLAAPEVVTFSGPLETGDPAPRLAIGVAPAAAVTIVIPEALAGPPEELPATVEEPVADDPIPDPSAAIATVHASAAVPPSEPPAEPVSRPERAEGGGQATPAGPSAAGVPDLDFEHLFEETTFRPAPAPPEPVALTEPATTAEVHESADRPADGFDGTDPITQIFDGDAESDPPAPTGAAQPSSGGLIDWVPGATPRGQATPPATELPPPPQRPVATGAPSHTHLPPPPAFAAPPPPSPTPPSSPSSADDTALEDATITLEALRSARESAGASPTGQQVTAVTCPAGHPNPTHNDQCRACGQAIVDRTPRTIPRPSLGRLRFADGTTTELDRHLLIGRNPATDLKVSGEDTGRVRLADPDNVLSRTHVAIQLDGWQVQVIDRDSMNHTYVEIPGRPPFQIRPGEPYPVPPGSTIRLGDEIGFVFEAEAT